MGVERNGKDGRELPREGYSSWPLNQRFVDWFANQKGKKKKKGSDLVMVALQTKALTANPRNTGGCQIKKPGKMRTKERGKKKKSTEGDWRTTRKEKQWFKY